MLFPDSFAVMCIGAEGQRTERKSSKSKLSKFYKSAVESNKFRLSLDTFLFASVSVRT